MRLPLSLAVSCAALLTGCMERTPIPQLLVNTTPPGASCEVTRLGQPIATAGPTPAIALVASGAGDIAILCRRHAFADAVATLPPVAPPSYGAVAADYQRRVDIVMTPLPSGAAR